MKDFPFISVVVGTFSHATEDVEKVRGTMASLLPKDAEIELKNTEGYHGNPIILLETKINKRAQLREWWKKFAEKIGAGVVEKILESLPENIDDSCNLYLRLEKSRACLGEYVLTSGGDPIHVKLKIGTRPAKKEIAVRHVRDFLKN